MPGKISWQGTLVDAYYTYPTNPGDKTILTIENRLGRHTIRLPGLLEIPTLIGKPHVIVLERNKAINSVLIRLTEGGKRITRSLH